MPSKKQNFPLPVDVNNVPIPYFSIKGSDGEPVFPDENSPLVTGEVTIPSGENHIGEVGGRLKIASAEFTRPADTSGYIARDVVSNSTGGSTLMQFDLARVAGGSGYIVKGRVITSNKTPTPRFRLWLYTINTPTVAVDNAQMTLLWANRANRIGFLDFPAVATEDATGSDSASTLAIAGTTNSIPLPFNCAAGDTRLYGLLQTLDSFTPLSGQQFYVELTADCN